MSLGSRKSDALTSLYKQIIHAMDGVEFDWILTNKWSNNLLPLDDFDLENFRAFAFALSDLPSLHPVSKGWLISTLQSSDIK